MKEKFRRLDDVWEKLMDRIKIDGMLDNDFSIEHDRVKDIEGEILEEMLQERKPAPVITQRHVLFGDLDVIKSKFKEDKAIIKDVSELNYETTIKEVVKSEDSNAEWDIKSETKDNSSEAEFDTRKGSKYPKQSETTREARDSCTELRATKTSRQESREEFEVPSESNSERINWHSIIENINRNINTLDTSLLALKNVPLPKANPYMSKEMQTEKEGMKHETVMSLSIKKYSTAKQSHTFTRLKSECKNLDDEIENRNMRTHKSFIRNSSVKTIELEEEEKNEAETWPANKGLVSMKSHLNEVAKCIAKDYKPHHKNRDSSRFMNITNI
eukprot:TRINITY_DN14287_c0_g4_i1.p1 TRINITY_DN14287_c0_g4~~TRINITY_DN14287_c0_g4_i1.p1  ORF type:complete len:329 (-),score=73.47 TRINITY_DN14287_c0_g4_i1:164-1150(-)